MITRTVTENVGEWFTDGAPDEWFAAHEASAARGHRNLTDEQKAIVRRIAEPPPAGLFWVVEVDGYWHRLCVVGLYDGWVFWRKRLCVGTDGPIPGMHQHEAYNLDDARLATDDPDGRWRKWRFVDDEVTS